MSHSGPSNQGPSGLFINMHMFNEFDNNLMEDLDDLEDDTVENPEREPRNFFKEYTDERFEARFKLSKNMVRDLIELLRPKIQPR